MQIEQPRKEAGVTRQNLKGALPQRNVSPEQKKQPTHDMGPSCELTMRRLIFLQLSSFQSLSECNRLPETQAKPLTGYGVHATRGIAHQCGIPPVHSAQCAGRCKSSALCAAQLRIRQASSQPGKLIQSFFESNSRLSGDQDNTRFFRPKG